MFYITHEKVKTIRYAIAKISAKLYVHPLTSNWQLHKIGAVDAASAIPLAKIRGFVNSGRATGENAGGALTGWQSAWASQTASVLSEESLYRYYTLPLSFKIRGSYWAWAKWLPDDMPLWHTFQIFTRENVDKNELKYAPVGVET